MDHVSTGLDLPHPAERNLLWQADRLASTTLFSENADVAEAEAVALSKALIGAGRRLAAIEVISTSLAAAKVQESALAALHATLIKRRDVRAALDTAKLLRHATERVASLAKAHAAIDPQPRCTVVVGTSSSPITVRATSGPS